jgi:hypothetical protein
MERREDFVRYIVAVAASFVPEFRLIHSGISHVIRIGALLALTLTTSIVTASLGVAQSTETALSEVARAIEVIHTPAGSPDIPPVGSLMKINLSLTNTIDIETKIRLVGTKDGRFIDIAFPRGALDRSDRPSFSVEIPSPVAMMSYQFVVHQKDGSLTSSRKFTIRRRCLQTFSVNIQDDKRTTAFRQEVASLIAQSHMLERDNKSLETSLKVLEEIKSSLSR